VTRHGDSPGAGSGHAAPRAASRAPAYVLIAGLGLAIALVLLGARLSATPAPAPDLSRPGTPGEPRQVNVLMHDYSFNPRTVYLVEGETVRFEVINAGLVDHEFVLGDADVQAAWAEAHARATPPAAFASPPPASVPPGLGGLRVVLRPGQSASLVYAVPAGAPLQLMCHLPGHLERGMAAPVEIEPR
jgi:uncharacterized cupredoxin-like copper-binding protein